MDLRAEELETLRAIYDDTLTLFLEPGLQNGETAAECGPEMPELELSSYCGEVAVPISLETPVQITSSAVSQKLHHLPPLRLAFSLPQGYPYEKCPHISVRSCILPEDVQKQLEQELCGLWHEMQDQVLFAMVDHLNGLAADPMALIGRGVGVKVAYLATHPTQTDSTAHLPASASQAETLSSPGCDVTLTQNNLQVAVSSNPQLMDRLITYNKEQELWRFRTLTYVCGICQENAFGERCFQFPLCEHVFCMLCLSDFFKALIEDANVEKIHCPDFECLKSIAAEREGQISQRAGSDFDFEAFKKKLMTPPILLEHLKSVLEWGESAKVPREKVPGDSQMPDSRQFYEKYLALFLDHQHNLIAKLFPARIVTCARDSCTNMIFRRDVSDLLVVCTQCGYAFCNNCRKSNHRKTKECMGVRQKREYYGVSEEELELWTAEKTPENSGKKELLRKTYGLDLLRKLALDYDMDKMDRLFLQLIADGDYSRCPTCDLVIQRLDGCNKMKCSSCYSFFCNVCGAFLPPDTPYEHFNEKSSACYGKLFHGMPGLEET